jgi:hypothetical protein
MLLIIVSLFVALATIVPLHRCDVSAGAASKSYIAGVLLTADVMVWLLHHAPSWRY